MVLLLVGLYHAYRFAERTHTHTRQKQYLLSIFFMQNMLLINLFILIIVPMIQISSCSLRAKWATNKFGQTTESSAAQMRRPWRRATQYRMVQKQATSHWRL